MTNEDDEDMIIIIIIIIKCWSIYGAGGRTAIINQVNALTGGQLYLDKSLIFSNFGIIFK